MKKSLKELWAIALQAPHIYFAPIMGAIKGIKLEYQRIFNSNDHHTNHLK